MELNPIFHKVIEPLAYYYSDPSTTEIRVNEPGKVVVEKRGSPKKLIDAPELDIATLETICQTIANEAGSSFDSDDKPKVSWRLPGGHRFECLVGASPTNGVSLAIRCKHPFEATWENFGIGKDVERYLRQAVLDRKNIIVSGATNTGKTTLLNMFLRLLPEEARVVAAEDTEELELKRFWDGKGLLVSRDEKNSMGMIDWREMYDHFMRITPDHIIFGEISTQNAFAALAALNSGISGFMCSIHAESPHQAINRKFDMNIAWAGDSMPRVGEFISELVDVVVQIKRTPDGRKEITDIFEPVNDNFILENKKLVTNICEETHLAKKAA